MTQRWMRALLALTLVLCLCTACGGRDGDRTEGDGGADRAVETAFGPYYETAGLAPDEVLLTAAGREIPAEMYLYWVAYNAAYMEDQLRTYAALYPDVFDEDGNVLWDQPVEGGMVPAQYVLDAADYAAVLYCALEDLAERNGAALTGEDRADMAAAIDSLAEQLGGGEQLEMRFAQMGITRSTYERMAAADYLFDNLIGKVLAEGSPLYLEPAAYEDYGTFADHILLSTVDAATGEALSPEEAAQKRATAEDILAQLQAAEDLPALFDQLADQYSEDPGRASNPDGYIFTAGEMVAEFEDAAAALAPGQISGIVETDYGYHILLRKDLQQGLADHPEQKAALAEAYVDRLLDEAAAVEPVRSEKLAALDVGAFYDAYIQAAVAMEPAGTETDGGETSGDTGDTGDTGETSNGDTAGAAEGDNAKE